jgi:hypothetical protein
MTKRAMPASAGPNWWMAVAVAAFLLGPGRPAAGAASGAPAGGGAGWRPALVGSVGGAFAVRGEPSDGGASASLAALWPVGARLSFGVMVHGDDAGSLVDSLRDASGAGLAFGKVEQVHRTAWGVSWRLDGTAPPRLGLTPFASATWGAYRVADDAHGESLGHVGSTGWSLAAGLRRDLGPHLALGLYTRYHRLFNDVEGRFMSAGLEGIWH